MRHPSRLQKGFQGPALQPCNQQTDESCRAGGWICNMRARKGRGKPEQEQVEEGKGDEGNLVVGGGGDSPLAVQGNADAA